MFKDRKWLGWTLLTLLALALVFGAGAVGYRIGRISTASIRIQPGSLPFGPGGFEFRAPGGGGGGPGEHLPFDFPEGFGHDFDGRQGFGDQHGFQSGSFVQRGGFNRGYSALSLLPRLLFGLAFLGLLAYVIVQVFRPGGWQLSFGPLHPPEKQNNKPAPRRAAKKA